MATSKVNKYMRVRTPPAETAYTSAGVFDDTGKLVRTLWTAQLNDPRANGPTSAWNGNLDDGTAAPAGDYVIKVIGNDMEYTWDGTIGNSSPDHTNMLYHNAGSHIVEMTINDDGEMHYVTAYGERWPVPCYTTTANPQVMNYPLQTGAKSNYSSQYHLCSDGINVYYGHIALDFSHSEVYAIKCSDKSLVTFAFGVVVGTPGDFTGSSISFRNTPGQITMSGMAVQKAGNYLFVTYIETDHVVVLHKTTGQLLHTVGTWNAPTNVAVSPTTGDLWLAYSVSTTVIDTVIKLSIAGDGTPSASGVSISGFLGVEGLDVSPDGTTLLVVDAGASQQVKAFNTSDGSVKAAFATSGVFGTAGGYATSPTVTNTKFMFKNMSNFGGNSAWIAYAPDGSWWLGDRGNNRSLHFTSGNSPTFIEHIMFQGAFYPCNLPRGEANPSVFAHFLEFENDYTKTTVTPTNGSWTLKNNWGYLFTVGQDPFTAMRYVGTYSNGRRYAMVVTAGQYHVYELTATGMRDTGAITMAGSGHYVDENLNQYFLFFTGAVATAQIHLIKFAFTGFDGSNNPTWSGVSTTVFVSEVVNLGTGFPPPQGDGNITVPAEGTSNGILPVFQTVASTPGGNTYPRLGGIELATGLVKYVSHFPTPDTHGGTDFLLTMLYPDAPYYSHRAGNNAGGPIVYRPGHETFFTNYRGEPWGGNQTNVWYHWHETGLCMRMFGPACPYFGAASLVFPFGHTETIPVGVTGSLAGIPTAYYDYKGMYGMTGNSAWGAISFVDGKYYLFQSDEFYHSGVARWTVDGLDTISVTEYPVSFNGVATSPNDPTDLLQGLPYGSLALPITAAGWTRDPGPPDTFPGVPWWHIYTNAIKFDLNESPDLACEFSGATQTNRLYRAIPRAGSGNWEINSTVFMAPCHGHPVTPVAGSSLLRIEIYDSANRIILQAVNTRAAGAGPGTFYINGAPIVPVEPFIDDWRSYCEALRAFDISMNVSTGLMNVRYGEFALEGVAVLNPLADAGDPIRFQITGLANAGGGSFIGIVVFTDLHFIDS